MSSSVSPTFLERLRKLFTRFPVRDTRYLAAASFLVGASLFAANGFLYIFQVKQPQLLFDTAGLAVTSMVGTFFFLVGCSCAILEAMNTIDQKIEGIKMMEDNVEAGEKHMSEKDEMLQSRQSATPVDGSDTSSSAVPVSSGLSTTPSIYLIGQPGFRWLPSGKDFRNIGFWAAIISWTGIIPFYISAIAYVPGVADLTNVNIYYYLTLLPYCLGGCFFTIAAVIQTILVQKKWYIPALNNEAWWSGLLWSVGSLGFALGGSLWYAGEGQYWSATLASFWGAWCWVVGSVLRCFTVVADH